MASSGAGTSEEWGLHAGGSSGANGAVLPPNQATVEALREQRRRWIAALQRGAKFQSCQAQKMRTEVVRLIRQKYAGEVGAWFGPTLAAEHLADGCWPKDFEAAKGKCGCIGKDERGVNTSVTSRKWTAAFMNSSRDAVLPQLRAEFRKYPAVYRTQEGIKAVMPVGMAAMFLSILVLAVTYALDIRAIGGRGSARFGALIGVFAVGALVLHNYVNLNIAVKITLQQSLPIFSSGPL